MELFLYKITHSWVSFINLKPITTSFPELLKSPILGLFLFGSGHGLSSIDKIFAALVSVLLER